MTAGEAVVLRDGSWAATLAATFVHTRACPVHETKQACHVICVPARCCTLFLVALDTHECSSCKSCG